MMGRASQGPALERRPVDPGMAPFSIEVGRRSGTVVVTVHGEVDLAVAQHLGVILADLIDGQGNLSIVVDLHDASTSEPDALWVFTDAAERAGRRGAAMRLAGPPAPLGEALQLRGLDALLAER